MSRLKNIATIIFAFFTAMTLNAEDLILYNDNGEGGIHKSRGKLVVSEGQYYVDLTVSAYGGKTKVERLKVERVRDSARILYNRDKWAERYVYVVERTAGPFRVDPYYFNMKSPWRPSLTQDPDDPNRIVPVKKIYVYRDDWNGGKIAVKAVVVKNEGQWYLYTGDDFFYSYIESNDEPVDSPEPAWTRKYKYRAKISMMWHFFNM